MGDWCEPNWPVLRPLHCQLALMGDRREPIGVKHGERSIPLQGMQLVLTVAQPFPCRERDWDRLLSTAPAPTRIQDPTNYSGPKGPRGLLGPSAKLSQRGSEVVGGLWRAALLPGYPGDRGVFAGFAFAVVLCWAPLRSLAPCGANWLFVCGCTYTLQLKCIVLRFLSSMVHSCPCGQSTTISNLLA